MTFAAVEKLGSLETKWGWKEKMSLSIVQSSFILAAGGTVELESVATKNGNFPVVGEGCACNIS
jgi:hypothetical protein